jgi:hypothetical protein
VNSNEEDSDDEGCGNYSDEIGWRVGASLRTVSPQNAWRVAKQIFQIDDEDSTTRMVARQYMCSLLLTAQPSRIQHAYVKYDFRNPDYPAGEKERALLFCYHRWQANSIVGLVRLPRLLKCACLVGIFLVHPEIDDPSKRE